MTQIHPHSYAKTQYFFMNPERFTAYVRAEIKKWNVVVKATGMRAD